MADKKNRVTSYQGIPVSYEPWGPYTKKYRKNLPPECFLWVEDPKKKSTWKYPYRFGAGGIDPKMGLFRKAGPISYYGVAAARQMAAGARSGVKAPAWLRKKLDAMAKALKMGPYSREEILDIYAAIFAEMEHRKCQE